MGCFWFGVGLLLVWFMKKMQFLKIIKSCQRLTGFSKQQTKPTPNQKQQIKQKNIFLKNHKKVLTSRF